MGGASSVLLRAQASNQPGNEANSAPSCYGLAAKHVCMRGRCMLCHYVIGLLYDACYNNFTYNVCTMHVHSK